MLGQTPYGFYPETILFQNFKCPTEKPLNFYLRYGAIYIEDQSFKDKLSKCEMTKGLVQGKKLQKTDREEEVLLIFERVKGLKSRSLLYQELEKLEKHNNIASTLIQSYIYFKVKSFYRGRREIQKIMKKDFHYHIFNSDISLMPIEKQVSLTIELLQKIKAVSKESDTFKSFLFYLYNNSNKYFQNALDEQFDLEKGIKFIRKMYKSNQIGKKLPFVWGPKLFELSSMSEYKEFLEETSILKELKKGDLSMLLFFEKLDSIPRNLKNIVLQSFKALEMKKKKTIYEEAVYYQLISSDFFYQFIRSNLKRNYGLVHNKQREFFRRVLRRGVSLRYALFQLIKLGDTKEEYLSVAKKSYVRL